jgi:hypothetical protein
MIYSIALFILVFLSTSCQKQEARKLDEVYTIGLHSAVRIYGIEIEKIFSMKFSEIEKAFNVSMEIDKQASVIVISKKRDFVLKIRGQIVNAIKDHIDVLYGPVQNSLLYKNPGSVLPRSVVFYGTLVMSEPNGTKQTIIKELAENLPKNNTTEEILDKINRYFITGTYREGQTFKINFEMAGYPIAYFYIAYSGKGEIVYRYVFSKDKEVYPRI